LAMRGAGPTDPAFTGWNSMAQTVDKATRRTSFKTIILESLRRRAESNIAWIGDEHWYLY